jgi:RHS repeat-associated protein
VIQDLDDNLEMISSYLNGPGIDNKIRRTDDENGNLYYLTDHLGSTIALTDDAGRVVEGIGYDSFGNNGGSARTRYGYTGRERDPDTGMLYYRARFYDPQVGRFLSEDPIGFRGGEPSFYIYVHNDPLRFRDPLGLRRCNPIVGGIVGGLVGGLAGTAIGAAVGGLGGAGIGCVAGALGIGGFATVIAGPFGTVGGGGVGCGAGAAILAGPGAAAGAVVGSAVGVGVGIGVGYDYCAKECDEPKVLPFPKTEPFPPPPPPKDLDDCFIRLLDCLRFAGTDPHRSEQCMLAFVECKKQLK